MYTMFKTKSIKTEHADIIHDVSFDHHGERMATCSSDQTVKVWDKGPDGNWHCTASWKNHSGPVWRVTWAHPDFGQVLATCSFDRTVAVWEEVSKSANAKLGKDTNHWSYKPSLVDSRTSVTDVRFGPKHLGLLMATCSVDGIVRIYEAVDVMNLSNWHKQHEITVTINNCNVSLSSLAWSNSRLHPPTIAVGCNDSNHPGEPKVFIYRNNDGSRRWDLVESLSKVTDPVNDVQFAPHLGRSFHMLAVASRELDIFSLKELGEESQDSTKNSGFEICHVGNFEDHKSVVWRVSWSVLGKKLTSTGSDGCVLLWKANYLGQWKCQMLKASGLTEADRVSMAASLSTTPTSTQQMRLTPPSGPMNFKRTSGWPLIDTDFDQAKMYY